MAPSPPRIWQVVEQIGDNIATHRHFLQLRPEPVFTAHVQQLDIFLDSRATLLANDVVVALRRRDVPGAMAAVATLRAEDAAHADLAAFGILLEFLNSADTLIRSCVDDAEALAQLVERVECQLLPASRAMGAAAEAFVLPFWVALAELAENLPNLMEDFPQAHAAALWLHAGNPRCAEAAAVKIARGNDSACVQRWLCLAYQAQGRLRESPMPLFRHAWLAPQAFASLFVELADKDWQRAWQDFGHALGDLDADWFPAWYLVEHPGTPFDETDAPALGSARASVLVVRLRILERQGYSHALVVERQELRDCDESFFTWYMARRQVRHR
jgi:hypothetical protein